jgi:hypothetical protein
MCAIFVGVNSFVSNFNNFKFDCYVWCKAGGRARHNGLAQSVAFQFKIIAAINEALNV